MGIMGLIHRRRQLATVHVCPYSDIHLASGRTRFRCAFSHRPDLLPSTPQMSLVGEQAKHLETHLLCVLGAESSKPKMDRGEQRHGKESS